MNEVFVTGPSGTQYCVISESEEDYYFAKVSKVVAPAATSEIFAVRAYDFYDFMDEMMCYLPELGEDKGVVMNAITVL